MEPGYIDTPMMQVTLRAGELDAEQLLGRIPAGRVGSPDDVARVVAFLLSDAASYITATTLRIDGGHLAYGGIPPASSMPPPIEGAD